MDGGGKWEGGRGKDGGVQLRGEGRKGRIRRCERRRERRGLVDGDSRREGGAALTATLEAEERAAPAEQAEWQEAGGGGAWAAKVLRSGGPCNTPSGDAGEKEGKGGSDGEGGEVAGNSCWMEVEVVGKARQLTAPPAPSRRAPQTQPRAMATPGHAQPAVFGALPHRVRELVAGSVPPSQGGVDGDAGMCWLASGSSLLIWKLDRGLHAHVLSLGELPPSPLGADPLGVASPLQRRADRCAAVAA